MGDGLSCHECRRYDCICGDTIPRQKAIESVLIEEELDGNMPEELYEAICSSREMLEKALRETVKITKENIINRIKKI